MANRWVTKMEFHSHHQQECPKGVLAIAQEKKIAVYTPMLQPEDTEADKEDKEGLMSKVFLPPPMQIFQLFTSEQIARNNEEQWHMEQVDIVIRALGHLYTLPVWDSL